jgi:type II secretory pathway pseudopilin PulG
MKPRTRRSNYPSHSDPGAGFSLHRFGPPVVVARNAPGYALLILMMVVTVLLVSLTAALPSIYQEGQREREEELIFRGNEYARAIGLFRRRFNRFPSSVNELLHTNGIRFLRRAYPDPMSRDGKWRFIHATINGALFDSKTMPGLGSSGGVPGQSALGGPQGQSSFGGPQRQTPFGGGQSSQFGPQQQAGSTSSSFGQGQEIQGAFIAGVASRNTKQSIRVLNHRTHYDEWEFLGLEGGSAGVASGLPQQSPGGQPGQPGQPGQLGTPQHPFQPAPQSPQGPGMPPLTDQPIPQ